MKKIIKNTGISLIALIITVIVVAILLGAAILRDRDENISTSAMKVQIKNNLTVIVEEYELYLSNEKADYVSEHKKPYDVTTLNMSSDQLNAALKTIEQADLKSKFVVESGELLYTGDDEDILSIIDEVSGVSVKE